MKALENNCFEFTDLLASAAPAPGGGGASGFAGALGVALSMMVGNLTVGKKKYADVEAEIKEYIKKCEQLKNSLLDTVAEDEEGFLPLAAAYGLPADTEEEKIKKAEIMEEGLKTAVKAPLKILKLCSEAAGYAFEFANKGSRLAVSDAGCSAALLQGAAKSAYLNILINTKLMKNREEAEKINAEADESLNNTVLVCENIYNTVLNGMK